MEKIKLMIADDQTLFLQAMAAMLDNIAGFEVIGQFSNGKDLLNQMKILVPNVVLLDMKMPVMDGPEALLLINKEFPEVKVIMLTMYDEEVFFLEMIKSGANSYLLKDSDIKIVENAIREVFINDFYYPEFVQKVIAEKNKNSKEKACNLFSQHELKVLKLICKEYSNAEIAEKVFLSPRTVEGYKKRLQNKAGVKSLAGLIVYAVKNKLVE